MEKNIEISTWIHFKKPGIKKEIIQLAKEVSDIDEFRDVLKERYQLSLTEAYTVSQRFYKK